MEPVVIAAGLAIAAVVTLVFLAGFALGRKYGPTREVYTVSIDWENDDDWLPYGGGGGGGAGNHVGGTFMGSGGGGGAGYKGDTHGAGG